MRRLPTSLVLGIALGALAACGGGAGGADTSTGPTKPTTPRSRIVISEMPVTTGRDSVMTELPGTLVATVYDSAGRPAVAAVLFMQVVSKAPDSFTELASIRTPGAIDWIPLTGASLRPLRTDSSGVIRLSMKLGKVATTVSVELRTATLFLAAPDTLVFAPIAGRTALIVPSPRDTAIYVDRTYQARARTTDAYGNATTDSVRFASDSTAATTSASGGITGRRIGRALHRLTAGNARDSIWTSVVPHGILTAVRPSYSGGGLVQFELDGSAISVITTRPVSGTAWSHDGSRLAFVDHSAPNYITSGRIIIRDQGTGAERPLVASYNIGGDWQATPVFSGDDASVVFAGPVQLSRIVRVRLDNGAADTIATPPPSPPDYGAVGEPTPDGAYTVYTDPAASVNGRYVAYSGLAPCCVTLVTYVKDLQKGTRAKIANRELPRWLGATDSLVAHVKDGFDVLRPDGTLVRGFRYPRIQHLGGMTYDVSPDGKWLAVSGDIASDITVSTPQVIELVDISTGMRLPLPFSIEWVLPTWRPQ